MFWSSFGFSGVETLTPIERMINSVYYMELIRRTVSRDRQMAFPEGGGVFQQNFAPCHATKLVKKVFSETLINILDWSGNSPDLNQ